MKNKILALSIVLLLTTVCLTSLSAPPVKATGEGQWITGYQIEDASTGQLLMEFNSTTGVNNTYSPVMPSADIKVTFTVNVFPGTGDLKLQTGLIKSQSNGYWELISEDYNLGTDYNPNANPTSFNWVQGEFTMVLHGKVPVTTSSTKAINVVSLLSSSGGTPIDKIAVIATSSDMASFQTIYDQKASKLQTLIDNGVAQGYIDIYTNVLNASQTLADNGNAADAIALLNGLNANNAPASSSMEMIFYPIIGVTAGLAVIFVVLFLRVRGKVSYFQLVVEDQIKDLEGLTLRASKIDRAMSSNLESVKDRLKRLVGM